MMNSKKAKKLRKKLAQEAKSKAIHYGRMKNGQVVCLGAKARYKRAKKELKNA